MRSPGLVRLIPALVLAIAPAIPAAGFASPAPSAGGSRSEFAGPGFRVSGTRATAQDGTPATAYNQHDDEFLVVWEDYRSLGARGSDIYGRRVDADGARLGRDFRINGPAAVTGDHSPDVAYDATSRQYLVVWEDNRNEKVWGSDIYARLVDADGTRLGHDLRISGGGAVADEMNPRVAFYPGMTRYLIVWQDWRNEAGRGSDIYGQVVDADGTRLGNNFRISGPEATADEGGPAVAVSGSYYLVVWPDERSYSDLGYIGFYGDIYGRFISTGGARIGSDFRVNGPGTSAGLGVAVATNQSNNLHLVVWQGVEGSGIYGQRVGYDGSALGSTFLVSEDTWDGQASPAVADGASELLVAWYRGFGDDVRARRVSPAGAPLGSSFDVGGTSATALERAPALAFGYAADAFLVVWEDYRNQEMRGADIYGRLVVRS